MCAIINVKIVLLNCDLPRQIRGVMTPFPYHVVLGAFDHNFEQVQTLMTQGFMATERVVHFVGLASICALDPR
jgi:hypothetical protein